MTPRTLASTLLTLSLATACASDDGKSSPNNDSAVQSKEQAVRSADASGKLLALSNAALGGGSSTRSSAVEDLEGDIQAGVDEFITTLSDPDCLSYTLDELSESQVAVRFDFSDCQGANGLDDITGGFDVTIDTDEEDVLDCDFEGDLTIDGYGFDGSWGIDASEDGSAVIAGDIGILLPDGTLLDALLDGLWRDVGTNCPSLTQHIEIGEGANAWSIDLSGLDMCTGSVCGSEIDLQIEGLEGLEGVDFSEYGSPLEGVNEGVFCDEDGDFVDYPELPGEEDVPGEEEVPDDDDF